MLEIEVKKNGERLMDIKIFKPSNEARKLLQGLVTLEDDKKPEWKITYFGDTDITKEEMSELFKKIPSSREIIDYISRSERYRHSFVELQMEFFGSVMSADKEKCPNQERVYRLFYSRLHRAHEKIQSSTGKKWIAETIVPIDSPKYKVWELE